jgi:RimJ/RimL family protein N-acetyltransferase
MDPILRDLPTQLETERLLIRCPLPGDGPAVHEAVVESLAALRAWPASLPWALPAPSVEASGIFCRQGQVQYLSRQRFPMLLFHKAHGRYVGGSGLHGVDWAVPACEVGYWCRQSYQGQGLVTEAVIAITRFAATALGMRRVTSLPDADNLPSCRVAEKAGYTLEGTLRHERKAPDGTLRNTCLFAWTG